MERKKGRLDLSEAIDFLENTAPVSETTWSNGYPDGGTGIAGDDDKPPGNIVYGEKYKKTPYFNRLTSFQKSWEVDVGEWKWDEFDNSQGMEDYDNYSDSLKGMEDLFTDKQWRDVWKRMKYVPDRVTTKRFAQAGQPWRKGGEDQLGSGMKEPYSDIKTNKDGTFKDSELKVENDELARRIDNITL